jgi:hypothetical protein
MDVFDLNHIFSDIMPFSNYSHGYDSCNYLWLYMNDNYIQRHICIYLSMTLFDQKYVFKNIFNFLR